MDIAERLQDLRKKAGYSQEQVAEQLGLSRQVVSKWESGVSLR
ncbi:MAG TPA: helix-turn-helix transcriptional regulator [Candidatus Avoscillospira avistercoris]|uniref:Helix-turn-helix transcriptional regulator n=1 Tax=Candidatus Avoscillospira avistercoris TaxID=2840707 RepID=A0A9D1F7Z6_9FIRM|nr:helix-turn-helix transcriptional regulator [Candidatus Avoscillospira avistercoris]